MALLESGRGFVQRTALSGVLMASMAFAACEAQKNAIPTPTIVPKSLTLGSDGKLYDQEPDHSVAFSFNPAYAQGSLQADICVVGGGKEVTIFSHENAPRPGDLGMWTFSIPLAAQPTQVACLDPKYPVIALQPGDDEQVDIGIGTSPDASRRNMTVYHIQRSKNLAASIIGTESKNPEDVHLRNGTGNPYSRRMEIEEIG